MRWKDGGLFSFSSNLCFNIRITLACRPNQVTEMKLLNFKDITPDAFIFSSPILAGILLLILLQILNHGFEFSCSWIRGFDSFEFVILCKSLAYYLKYTCFSGSDGDHSHSRFSNILAVEQSVGFFLEAAIDLSRSMFLRFNLNLGLYRCIIHFFLL